MSTDEDSNSTTPSSSPSAETEEQPPASFDLGAKLAQRLREHTADRDRTQRLIDHETIQLQNLAKTAPKRPRETKNALQQKAKKIERDRTSRSLPLTQEKALIRQIDTTKKLIRQHDQAEQHQQLIRRKKAEVEASREVLRNLNVTISEIEIALSRVELGKKLKVLPRDMVTREVACPPNKLNWVLGKAGENLKVIEDDVGVKVDVDRIRGNICVRGNGKATSEAVSRLEKFTKSVDEELKASPEVMAYLLMHGWQVKKLKDNNPDVLIDIVAKAIKMRGLPDNVAKVKDDIAFLSVVTQSRSLVGRETTLILGKTGDAISDISERHCVAVGTHKERAERSSLRITGPAKNVSAAMAEVDKLLFEHEEIEESFVVDQLLKSGLLKNSGAGIKEFQRSVSSVVAANTDQPEASSVLLKFGRNSSKDEFPRLKLKCCRCVMKRAKSLVSKKLAQSESWIERIDVSEEMIPTIIGKGGATINELRNEGKGALVETITGEGIVKVYSSDAGTRKAIRNRVEKIVAENQVGYVPISTKVIPFLLGDPGKDVRKACAELGCDLNVNDDDSKVIIKGTNEQINQATELLSVFLEKNCIEELAIDTDDEPLLFMGGSDSILHKVETDHELKAIFRKGKHLIQFRGRADKARAAVDDVKCFLNGGDGVAVCKFNVPEQAVGAVIGKGGSNIAKLETEFEGVLVHVPKDGGKISIRGPDEMVKQCRIRLISTVATSRVSETIDITHQQHEELSKTDVIKRISRFTNAQLLLRETSIKLRGTTDDVRFARANVMEHLTGVYHSFIDLENSQSKRVKNTITKDPSHFERICASTGADVSIGPSDCTIHIFGKKSSVKKAKTSVLEFLSFLLPRQLQTLKIHRSLFKSMGDPVRLARIATETGTSISLDRDMSSIIIRSDESDDCDKALDLMKETMVECEKLNAVLRLNASDAWLLPIILGKGGSNIQKLEKDTRCQLHIFKDELTVVVSANKEEFVQVGKEALERVIHQAKRECIFIELPESCMAAFIGRGGTGIKQLAVKNDVQIERTKKRPSTIKITGKESCVESARSEVMSWLKEWEASNIGITIFFEEKHISSILGKGGETVRSIEKETGCKIDIDRQNLVLTVRSGSDANREATLNKIQAIIDGEEEKAAGRALAKAELREELGKSSVTKAKNDVGSKVQASNTGQSPNNMADLSGVKNRSGEFAAVPVGAVPLADEEKGFNPAIHGTEEGRQLYQWLISGKVGDAIADIVFHDSGPPSPSSVGSTEQRITTKQDAKGHEIYYYQSESGFSVRL